VILGYNNSASKVFIDKKVSNFEMIRHHASMIDVGDKKLLLLLSVALILVVVVESIGEYIDVIYVLTTP
jgi:hypothetical protein